jgi:hypothetical protein
MARGTSQDERREAVTLIAADDLPPPDDIDAAFEDWRTGFATGEEPGKLRAYEIPLDERGNPIATARNQIRLGSWPIDLYGFDELCTMLIRDFMPPEKVLAVRLLGVRAGRSGVQFNKIVILKAPRYNNDGHGPAPPAESVTGMMKAIQEGNERTMALVRSMQPPPQPDNQLERILAMSQALNAPMNQMVMALIPALVGRPTGGGMDMGGLSGVLDVAMKIADLKGGGGDASTGNDLVDTIRAIIPIAKPALEAIPAIMQSRGALPMAGPGGGVPALTGPMQDAPRPNPVQGAVPAVAASPRPLPTTGPPPGSVPTQPPPPAVGVTPTPQLGDLPSGDQEMLHQIMPQIDSLVTMAERGSPAEGAADLIFDTYIMDLPESPDDVIFKRTAALLCGPNLIKHAAIFNPKVLTFEAWFRQFQQQIIKRYADEDKAADAESAA